MGFESLSAHHLFSQQSPAQSKASADLPTPLDIETECTKLHVVPNFAHAVPPSNRQGISASLPDQSEPVRLYPQGHSGESPLQIIAELSHKPINLHYDKCATDAPDLTGTSTIASQSDPQLEHVIAVWDRLPVHIRAAITALVGTAQPTSAAVEELK